MSGQLALDGFEVSPRARRLSLFFALRPDARAASEAAQVAARIAAQHGVRFAADRIERLHVTLFHIGHYLDEVPETVLAAARQAAQGVHAGPFDLAVDVLCNFGHDAVVLTPSQTCAPLMAFQSQLDRAMKRAGLIHGEAIRSYSPHLTLFYGARVAQQVLDAPVQWRIDRWSLICSVVGEGHHDELGAWPLMGADVATDAERRAP